MPFTSTQVDLDYCGGISYELIRMAGPSFQLNQEVTFEETFFEASL